MKLLDLPFAAALLAVVCATASSVEDRFALSYGKIKMLESCIGKEEMKAQRALLKDAYKTCKSRPVNIKGQPSASENEDPQVAPLAEGEYRYFTEDKVRSLSQKLNAKISNKTCVYQELGYIDESYEPLYDNIMKKISDITELDQELRKDLLNGVTSCRQMATCIPTDNMQAPLTTAMVRFKAFYKCYKKCKLMACIRKDLRDKGEEFDFSVPEDLSDDEEEDDKMIELIWDTTALGNMNFK